MECIMTVGFFILAVAMTIIAFVEDKQGKQIAEEEDEWEELTR